MRNGGECLVFRVLPLMALLLVTCSPDYPPFLWQRTRSLRVISGQSGTVQASAADVEGDSVSLRFNWGDGSISEWSPFVAAREVVSASHVWADHGALHVLTQAKDRRENKSDWQGDLEVLVLDSAVVQWVDSIGSGISECPAVGPDGTIYVVSGRRLLALASDGSHKWELSYGGYFDAPVLGEDGTVYVQPDYLRALTADGVEKWRFPSRAEHRYPPAIVAGGTVILPLDDTLFALAPDGAPVWSLCVGGEILSAPAVAADGTIYCLVRRSSKWGLCSVSVDGTLRWFIESEYSLRGDPAIGNEGEVYVLDDGCGLNAINPDSTLGWRYQAGWLDVSSPVVGMGGTVFLVCGRMYVLGVNSQGGPVWRVDMPLDGALPPAIDSRGVLHISGGNDSIYALSPDSTVKWCVVTADYTYCPPSIGPNGIVYVGDSDGFLYALKAGAPLAASPWPKYRHDARNSGFAGAK